MCVQRRPQDAFSRFWAPTTPFHKIWQVKERTALETTPMRIGGRTDPSQHIRKRSSELRRPSALLNHRLDPPEAIRLNTGSIKRRHACTSWTWGLPQRRGCTASASDYLDLSGTITVPGIQSYEHFHANISDGTPQAVRTHELRHHKHRLPLQLPMVKVTDLLG